MAKLEQAIGQLHAVGALVTVIATVETVADVHQLAAMSEGATVERQFVDGALVRESFRVAVDDGLIVVQAYRPAMPVDFDALEPAVRA